MSARLIVLSDFMRTPVAVNPAHVTEVHQRADKRVDILMVNSSPGDDNTVLTVIGTFAEIVALLNGEPELPS